MIQLNDLSILESNIICFRLVLNEDLYSGIQKFSNRTGNITILNNDGTTSAFCITNFYESLYNNFEHKLGFKNMYLVECNLSYSLASILPNDIQRLITSNNIKALIKYDFIENYIIYTDDYENVSITNLSLEIYLTDKKNKTIPLNNQFNPVFLLSSNSTPSSDNKSSIIAASLVLIAINIIIIAIAIIKHNSKSKNLNDQTFEVGVPTFNPKDPSSI